MLHSLLSFLYHLYSPLHLLCLPLWGIKCIIYLPKAFLNSIVSSKCSKMDIVLPGYIQIQAHVYVNPKNNK